MHVHINCMWVFFGTWTQSNTPPKFKLSIIIGKEHQLRHDCRTCRTFLYVLLEYVFDSWLSHVCNLQRMVEKIYISVLFGGISLWCQEMTGQTSWRLQKGNSNSNNPWLYLNMQKIEWPQSVEQRARTSRAPLLSTKRQRIENIGQTPFNLQHLGTWVRLWHKQHENMHPCSLSKLNNFGGIFTHTLRPLSRTLASSFTCLIVTYGRT